MGVEISVIIPNYNHAPFLKQRIESVLNQTYQNFEIIILDDCSTDNSKEIIELYKGDDRISNIIYNNVNSGSPFRQWQKGIALAKGKYIWIAESDDYCTNNFLECALSHLKKHNHSLHYCQSYNTDENNNIINDNFWWTENISKVNWHQPFYMMGTEFISKALQFQNVIPNASAVVFEKKKFNFDLLDKFKTAGDWLFWVRTLLTEDISYSNEILNYFRSHSSTTRSTPTPKQRKLRHFEVLAVKYNVAYKYKLGDKTRVKEFLKICIDMCSIQDTYFFSNSCKELRLPKRFILTFIFRKSIVNQYTNRVRWLVYPGKKTA